MTRTRGGLATTLNEIARQSGGMMLQEKGVAGDAGGGRSLRVSGWTRCMANEGKLVAICPKCDAETLLNALRSHPLAWMLPSLAASMKIHIISCR